MKKHLLLTLFAITLSYVKSNGQSHSDGFIQLDNAKKLTVSEVIELIEPHYILSYQDKIIPFEKKIFLAAGKYSITDLLVLLCQGNGIRFQIEGDQVFISPKKRKVRTPSIPKYITLSGSITNIKNGEAVIGASITTQTNIGSSSNSYGFFSITVPKGEHTFTIRHTSFKNQQLKLNLIESQTYKVTLEENVGQLDEVVITGYQRNENISRTVSGVNKLTFNEDSDIPYFLGEVDVLQSSLLLPGITNLGEDSNGINIRGGSTSQNLILLDEAVIFNSNHFFGLISVFNPESVNDVEIFKGNPPARFGGRNASVINIRQREGNDKNFNVAGGVGFVAGRLTVEGPIIKEKLSFLVSARRSVLAFVLGITDFTSTGETTANFDDINFKINLKADPKNRFYLSGYVGNDRTSTQFQTFRRWGNRSLTSRWNHIFNDQLFLNTSLVFSEYQYRVTDQREPGSFLGTSKIFNYNFKLDFNYFLHKNQLLSFGGGLNTIQSNPGDRLPLFNENSTNPIQLDTEVAISPYLYFEQEGKFKQLNYNLGLRLTSFHSIGKDEVFIYDSPTRSPESVVDTITYKNGEIVKSYFGLEPRAFLSYQINNNSFLKTSYARNYQYLQLISNTITPSPTDIWKISDTYIEPSITNQYSFGYYRNLLNNKIEASAELYYRGSRNVLAFKDNADILLNERIETEVLSGIGRSYGLELYVKKNSGRLTGWISYALSKSETRVANEIPELEINSGDYFPTNIDQTHQFSATGIYSISKRLSISSNFIFVTGKPTTLPSAKFELNGITVPRFTARNQDRLPNYHRLDLSIRLSGKKGKIKKNKKIKKREDYWTFSIYNVYSRDNVFSLVFRETGMETNNTEIIPFIVLGDAIPSVTYNFKF